MQCFYQIGQVFCLAVGMLWFLGCGQNPPDGNQPDGQVDDSHYDDFDTPGDGCICPDSTDEDQKPDCPPIYDECPSYAFIPGGYFCEGDQLFGCPIACDPNCGCYGRGEFSETCSHGCIDDQDGKAHCQEYENCACYDKAKEHNYGSYCDNNQVHFCYLPSGPEEPCIDDIVSDCGDGYCMEAGGSGAYCCSSAPPIDECPENIGPEEYFCDDDSLVQCHFECTNCACAKKKVLVEECTYRCVQDEYSNSAYCEPDPGTQGFSQPCCVKDKACEQPEIGQCKADLLCHVIAQGPYLALGVCTKECDKENHCPETPEGAFCNQGLCEFPCDTNLCGVDGCDRGEQCPKELACRYVPGQDRCMY